MAWREHVEFWAGILRYIRGPKMLYLGGLLLAFAGAMYANVLQLIVIGVFQKFGVSLTAESIPWYAAPLFLVAGMILVLVNHFFPDSLLPQAYPQDEQFIREIRQRMDERTYNFLRKRDLGQYHFKANLLDPLEELQRMTGARFQFVNPRLQREWQSVRDANMVFLDLIHEHTDMSEHPSMEYLTPYRRNENHDWHEPETAAKIQSLNDAGTNVADRFDTFDALARRLIPNVV